MRMKLFKFNESSEELDCKELAKYFAPSVPMLFPEGLVKNLKGNLPSTKLIEKN